MLRGNQTRSQTWKKKPWKPGERPLSGRGGQALRQTLSLAGPSWLPGHRGPAAAAESRRLSALIRSGPTEQGLLLTHSFAHVFLSAPADARRHPVGGTQRISCR